MQNKMIDLRSYALGEIQNLIKVMEKLGCKWAGNSLQGISLPSLSHILIRNNEEYTFFDGDSSEIKKLVNYGHKYTTPTELETELKKEFSEKKSTRIPKWVITLVSLDTNRITASAEILGVPLYFSVVNTEDDRKYALLSSKKKDYKIRPGLHVFPSIYEASKAIEALIADIDPSYTYTSESFLVNVEEIDDIIEEIISSEKLPTIPEFLEKEGIEPPGNLSMDQFCDQILKAVEVRRLHL